MTGASSQKFYVSHLGLKYGPWELEEIFSKLREMQLIGTDLILDPQSGKWVALLAFAPLMKLIEENQRPPEEAGRGSPASQSAAEHLPVPQAPAQTEIPKWYILRGQSQVGPLTTDHLIRALQDKTLFAFDLIWSEGMAEWAPVATVSEFSEQSIRQRLFDHNFKNAFRERQHARGPYVVPVLAHDNHQVWRAKSYEGSEGGSGLIILNSQLRPGSVLHVHFAANQNIPAFNALGEVVSKKPVVHREKTAPVEYGIKFLRVENEIRNLLRQTFEKKTS